MKASAQILVQRYLDGDLSDLELEAFREDLSKDPHLASMLEREVQLDAAIINDAYSIEPPAELRAAVLQSLPGAGSSWTLSVIGRVALSIAIGGVFLLTSLVSIGTNSMRRVDAPVSKVAPAIATSAASRAVEHSRSAPGRVLSTDASIPRSFSSRDVVADVEIADVLVEPTRHMHMPFEALQRTWGEQQSERFLDLGDASVSSLPAGLFGGMVGTSMVSLRYELDLLEDSKVFVEAGGLQQPRTSTAYVNGEATSVVASGISPFLSIGLAGVLVDQNTIGYAINGSASIGITSAGPMAMADVSAQLIDFGHTTLDVGMRFSALFDLGSRSTSSVSAAPFVRMGIPLR